MSSSSTAGYSRSAMWSSGAQNKRAAHSLWWNVCQMPGSCPSHQPWQILWLWWVLCFPGRTPDLATDLPLRDPGLPWISIWEGRDASFLTQLVLHLLWRVLKLIIYWNDTEVGGKSINKRNNSHKSGQWLPLKGLGWEAGVTESSTQRGF